MGLQLQSLITPIPPGGGRRFLKVVEVLGSFGSVFHSVHIEADDVADQWGEVVPVGRVSHRERSFFGVQGFCPFGLFRPCPYSASVAIQRRAIACAGHDFYAAGMFASSAHECKPKELQGVAPQLNHYLLDRYFSPPGNVFRVHEAKVPGARVVG